MLAYLPKILCHFSQPQPPRAKELPFYIIILLLTSSILLEEILIGVRVEEFSQFLVYVDDSFQLFFGGLFIMIIISYII